MRSSKILALGLVLALFASCAPKARVNMTVEGAPATKLAVHKLNVSSSDLLDSVKTDANGSFKYSLPVKKGQPEFVYIYNGDTRLAALLLEAGETAKVTADTLGNYSVEGSEGSAELAGIEKAYSEFISQMAAATESGEATKLYVRYHRDRTAYVLNHTHSLAIVPVLFQNLAAELPIFSQSTDALIFRAAADSLKTVYPESKYVKALETEADRRLNNMAIEHAVLNAEQAGFPDISLPDVNAEKVSLAGVDAKVILLHFWDVSDAEQKLFNVEVLLPVYEKYHSKGLEIYSVGVTADKALWASVIRNQKLPWINVCDGLGAASPAVGLYNLQTLPTTILIAGDEISAAKIDGEAGLRRELAKLLK
ncbi:MAG: hypothetical protein J6X39_06720 [Bacteroidales bacterium]|nr:hypothetical protein [Bacteroidales bacterium]